MWNNGNGNGQGYGQPQQQYGQQGYQQQAPQQQYNDDAYNRMNNARERGGARFPFIEAGRHILCLTTLEKFQHRKDGTCVRALFEVLESPVHPIGSFVVKIYKINMQPKFESSLSDAEQLADLCMKMKGAPKGYPIGNAIRTLLEERPQEQLARGTVVEATGVANKKGTWVDLYWGTIAQTPEQIVAHRQRLEAKGIPNTGSQQPQQQGYGGGAPVQPSMQPQQGYQQPPAPQQQYPQNPGMPTQQGYGAPPQQYVGAPVAAPAPQGGFLAQIPPQGGNGQGNGGW